MNVNVQTVSRAKPAPTFNLTPNAHIIRSDAEAIEIAQALAAEFAVEAATRDREQRLPAAGKVQADRRAGHRSTGAICHRAAEPSGKLREAGKIG